MIDAGGATDITGLIAAYANASPRVRYQLQEITRIVKDFHHENPDWKTSAAPEFRPIGVRDLTETRTRPPSRLLRDRLTPRQLEQLIASCGEGCTIADAARTYGISPSSVSRLLREAGAQRSPLRPTPRGVSPTSNCF